MLIPFLPPYSPVIWYAGLVPLSESTGEFLIAEANGYYSLRFTDGNGCTSMSEAYYFEWDPVGLGYIGDNDLFDIQLIDSQLYFKNADGYLYRIFSLSGILLFAGHVEKGALDMSACAPGLYLVQLQSGNLAMSRKIIME